jgi:hypothetical protein
MTGWVYHIGVSSVGHEYCHLRFLTIRGKSVAMYKRDPLDNPEIDFYVLRLYNPMDQNMKGQIACANPGEVRKWLEAFEEARLQAEYDMMRGVSWNENEYVGFLNACE